MSASGKSRRRPVEEYHDVWALNYDFGYSARAGLYHEVTRDSIVSLLPETRDAVILDVGCGTGIWAREILTLGFRNLALVDISARMLEACRTALGPAKESCSFDRLDALDLSDLPADRFDFVLAQGDVISYCGEPTRAISEIVRTTRPGGSILISVEGRLGNARRLVRQGDFEAARECLANGSLLVGNPEWARPFPAHAFTPATLESIVANAGLEVLWLKGKTIFECEMSIQDMRTKRGEWLLEFERRHNRCPAFLATCMHLEIAAKKRALI